MKPAVRLILKRYSTIELTFCITQPSKEEFFDEELRKISKENIQRCSDKWNGQWNKCVECQEQYSFLS